MKMLKETFTAEEKEIGKYETQMLNFALERLAHIRSSTHERPSLEESAYLEVFLLHYRNLLEILLADKHYLKHGIHGSYYGLISQFLSHSTPVRARQTMEWPVEKMYSDIRPAIERFESAPSTSQPALHASGLTSVSTTTSSVVNLALPEPWPKSFRP